MQLLIYNSCNFYKQETCNIPKFVLPKYKMNMCSPNITDQAMSSQNSAAADFSRPLFRSTTETLDWLLTIVNGRRSAVTKPCLQFGSLGLWSHWGVAYRCLPSIVHRMREVTGSQIKYLSYSTIFYVTHCWNIVQGSQTRFKLCHDTRCLADITR